MAAATKEPKKVKKGFKMPHLFWIMICLLFVSSLLTYVIPAGQFMTDPEPVRSSVTSSSIWAPRPRLVPCRYSCC